MLRYLTERLPVMITPKWVRRRSTPIALENVLTYTIAAADGCPAFVTTTSVTITPDPTLTTISYAGSPFYSINHNFIKSYFQICSKAKRHYFNDIILKKLRTFIAQQLDSHKSLSIIKNDTLNKIHHYGRFNQRS
mgnify:CR=1 FL=1